MNQQDFLNQILSEGSQPTAMEDYIRVHELASALSDRLEIEGLEIEAHKKQKKQADEVTEGFGTDCVVFSLSAHPLEGPLYWIMNIHELEAFCSWSLTKNYSAEYFHNKELFKGYYSFIFLQAISSLKTLPFFSKLQIQILDTETIENACQCIDIQFASQNSRCSGRLAISESAYNSFKKTVAQTTDFSKHTTPISLHVIAGKVNLSHEEKNSLSVGDFLILDSIQYDPKTHQGTMDLYFDRHPIFRVMLKQSKIRLLDFYHQAEPLKDHAHEIYAEMAKISLPAHKLYSLKPEDSLDITINPSQQLSLVEKNKVFAHAELLQVGEVVGVRILEIF